MANNIASKLRIITLSRIRFVALASLFIGSAVNGTAAAQDAEVQEIAAVDDFSAAYPNSLQGYWQGITTIGPKGARTHVRAELVFGYGRRLSPPDTTLPMAERHSVVWETISSESSGEGAGRFCEVLSFSSHARVEFEDGPEYFGDAGTKASLVTVSGTVCGIFNRTGDKLVVAWSTSATKAYPENFEPTESIQVADLQKLSSDIFPTEIEGKWSGVPLIATKPGANGEFEQVS